MVSGLRHRLLHDYYGINWTIIVDVIFDEMNDFIQSLKTIKFNYFFVCLALRLLKIFTAIYSIFVVYDRFFIFCLYILYIVNSVDKIIKIMYHIFVINSS